MNDPQYKNRLVKRMELQGSIMKIMADHNLDALIYPHQRNIVARIVETQSPHNGSLAAVTGFPSIVVPAGFSKPTETAPLGVPIGVEFTGRPWSEATLIKLAYAFEQTTKFRQPPMSTPPIR